MKGHPYAMLYECKRCGFEWTEDLPTDESLKTPIAMAPGIVTDVSSANDKPAA